MKITIERSSLLSSLGHVQNVVERRNTIPILSNVLMAAENGRLSLTATDLDLSAVEAVDAEVGQAGATTTGAHMLYDIVRKLPEGAQVDFSPRRRWRPPVGHLGALVLQAAVPAARGFPGHERGRSAAPIHLVGR